MTIEQILNLVACLALIAFGVYAILQPRASATLGGLTINGAKGMTEIRVAFGAFSLGLGAAPLLLNQVAAYQTSGIVLLAAIVVRAVSLFIDRPPVDRGFIVTAIFELAVGLILFLV